MVSEELFWERIIALVFIKTNDIAWNSDIYAVESAIENLQSTGGATFQGDVMVEVTRGRPECNATACYAYNRTNGTSKREKSQRVNNRQNF